MWKKNVCIDVSVHRYLCTYIQKSVCKDMLIIWSVYVWMDRTPNRISLAKTPPPYIRINYSQARNWGQWHEELQYRSVTRVWRKSFWVAIPLKASTAKSHSNPKLTSKNGGLTKLLWNSNSNTYLKVFGECLYKQKGTLLLLCSVPGRAASCLSQHASSAVYSQHSLHSAKGRWDVDNFPERQCFLIPLLFLKQKGKLFSLFLFFQIKINYNPYSLINAGWSCP